MLSPDFRRQISVARFPFEEIRGHSHWLIGEPGWKDIAERVLEFFETIPARAKAKTAS